MQVTQATVYTPERGHGWQRPAQANFNDCEPVVPQSRATSPDYVGPLDVPGLRDGVEDAQPLTFLMDVPPGRYWVSATVERHRAFQHDLNVRLNGSMVAIHLDAWGHVWRSQGGTPTTTVATIAEPVGDPLQLGLDCTFENLKGEPHKGDYSIPAGGSLMLRYRFCFRVGDEKAAQVAARYAECATMCAEEALFR